MNEAILVVEDDANDITFVKMAMKNAGVTNPVRVVHDGQVAIDYFQGAGKFADRAEFPLPYLVLLDLKLPYVMGLDVLGWIRDQSQFKSTIIIILTSSRHTEDIRMAYQLGANAYLVKPTALNALEHMIRALKDFWLTQNTPSPEQDTPAKHGKPAARETAER